MVLDLGSSNFKFKLKVGGEYQKRTPVMQDAYTSPNDTTPKDPVANNVQEGVGASMQFVIDPYIEFGVNGAIGRQEYTNAYGSSPMGPNYTAALPGTTRRRAWADSPILGWLTCGWWAWAST